jgi:hypothetical protein
VNASQPQPRPSTPAANTRARATCWWSAAASTAPASRATWPGAAAAVVLCEKDDLAQHTSSSSTKLIHGGLRYLEYYEFGWCARHWPNASGCCAARRTSCGRCAS